MTRQTFKNPQKRGANGWNEYLYIDSQSSVEIVIFNSYIRDNTIFSMGSYCTVSSSTYQYFWQLEPETTAGTFTEPWTFIHALPNPHPCRNLYQAVNTYGTGTESSSNGGDGYAGKYLQIRRGFDYVPGTEAPPPPPWPMPVGTRGEDKPDTDPRNDFDDRPRPRPKIDIKTGPGDLDQPIDLNKRPSYKDRVTDPTGDKPPPLPPEFLPWFKPWNPPPDFDLDPNLDLAPPPPAPPDIEPESRPDTNEPRRNRRRRPPTVIKIRTPNTGPNLKKPPPRNPPFTVDLKKPFDPEEDQDMPTQTQPWGQCSCPKQSQVDLEEEEMITYINVPVEILTAEFDDEQNIWVAKQSTQYVPVLQLKTGSEARQIQEEYKHRNQMVRDLVDLKNRKDECDHVYGIPVATYDETVVYHPQLFLELRGDNKIEMQVSYRLLQGVRDKTLQERIGREFSSFEFDKGIYRASYHDPASGMRLIILYKEAKQVEELIKKLFRLTNGTPDLAGYLKMDPRAIAKTGQYTPEGKVKPKYRINKAPGRRQLFDRRVGKVKLNRAYILAHGAAPKLIWHSNPLKNPKFT
ncbi:hypothetical protein VB712_04805 [Spirulina sp. CCNP1310]|uniref:hypothetical protein n=1 Tax=Spirulina sp. CCNP1310 TaxID=3110249 RepID=UPI002B1EFC30|nr:hypothetical protein [Spirulina sp. CCNP1310]MEA5418536.1 hypothetical protein [Spirulina sp. CCNP1310]